MMLFEQPYTVVEGTVEQGILLIDRLFAYDCILYRIQKSGKDELEQIKKVSTMLKEDGKMLVVSDEKEKLYVVAELFQQAGYVVTQTTDYLCISKGETEQILPKKLTQDSISEWVKNAGFEGRVLEVNADNASIPSVIWQHNKQEGSTMSFMILKERKHEEKQKGLPYLMRQSLIYQEKVQRIYLNE